MTVLSMPHFTPDAVSRLYLIASRSNSDAPSRCSFIVRSTEPISRSIESVQEQPHVGGKHPCRHSFRRETDRGMFPRPRMGEERRELRGRRSSDDANL
jgi:hypothetical protein